MTASTPLVRHAGDRASRGILDPGPSIASVAEGEVIAETDRVVVRPWRVEDADRFYDMHVHNHMQAVITVDDPAIFTKKFVLSKNEYRWIPDQEAEEQICVPSEMINYMSLISRPSFGVDETSSPAK